VNARATKSAPLKSLLDVFSEIDDPRVERTRLHPLVNVLTMSLVGAMAGADGWDALALYAREHEDVFEGFLDMSAGTPSADTFRRVFEALPPATFQAAFRDWLQPLLDDLKGKTIAMDGKTLRGALAHSRKRGGSFHLLHVWATEHRVLLGQAAVETAGNEAAAACELLAALDIKGATITADAASCTAEVTQTIRDGGGHYLLATKANQPCLLEHVQRRFAEAGADEATDKNVTDNKAHGRLERRIAHVLPIGKLPANVSAPWADMKSIVRVDRIRVTNNVSLARAYYISSHSPKSKGLAARIRDHWKVENQLHHILDVSFGDDRRKIRSEWGAQNFALVCRHALSLFKREPSKMSVAMKKRRAMWQPSFCLKLLTYGFQGI